MLNQEQINELKEILEGSQNPLFFFDNDVDGLCSFLILKRALDRGKGVAIKSFPELDERYTKKIDELNPDAIFILDKPRVSEGFVNEVKKRNLPLIWIDHHDIQVKKEILKKLSYFNSAPSSEPTVYISQKVFNRKQDLWLALVGCIADAYMPEYASEVEKDYPELINSSLDVFEALHTTELGRLINMLNFGLKDSTTNVLKMMKILAKAKGPHDILEETPKTKYLHQHYNRLNREYTKLIEKAESQKNKSEKMLFFEYGGEISMSSELSNRLFFKHQDKLIVVAYKKQDKVNLSIRGKNSRKITLEAIKNIENSSGGGHEEACGAQVPSDKFNILKENFEKLV